MVRKNFYRSVIVGASFVLVCADAHAGQIKQVCSAKSVTGIPTTIASYTSGGEPGICYSVSYDQNGSDKAPNYTIYRRGTPFLISASKVPSQYSYAAFDQLNACLKNCAKSLTSGDATKIAQARDKSVKKVAQTDTSKDPDPSANTKPGTKNDGTVAAGEDGKNTVENKTEVTTARRREDEGKTQTDISTSDDGKITRKSYVDTDGDHTLDPGEDVTKTEIGKEVNGRFVATETIRSSDKSTNSTRYTYTDANGDEHELTNAAEAKAWAEKNDASYATVTKNGKTYRIDPKTGELYSDKEKKDKLAADVGRDKKELDQEKKDLSDPCSVSLKIAQKKFAAKEITQEQLAKFRCQDSQDWAKGAEIANQVLTTAGRTVVNTMGSQAVQSARRGTFADAQDGAAKMAKSTQTYETVLGVANLAATAKLTLAAKKHKKAVGELAAWQEKNTSGSAYGDKGADGFQEGAMSQARYEAAIKEQTGAQNLAATAAMRTAIQGLQSVTAAKVAAKIAKDSKANANLARKNEALAAQQIFNYDPNQLAGPGATNNFDPNASAATGDGTQNLSDASTTDLDPNQPGGPLLGGGNDLGGGDDSLNAPVAGKFKAGGATSGGGGGGSPGGGSAGGGGGGGSPAAQEESKAAYASEFGTKERYESGGGSAPGAKGGGKGGKDDAGIDLNGLLAQFLPKGEEDMGSKNGILDSVGFGGSRSVAAEEPASLLDKNADLFQRIHETMSEKNRKGQLGI